MADLTDCPTGTEIGPGVHTLRIVSSERKRNRNNNGEHLVLVLQRDDGAEILDRLNLWNQNAKAVKWAKARMAAIVRACGMTAAPKDSVALHNIPMSVTVAETEKSDPQTGAPRTYVEVTGYAPVALTVADNQGAANPAGDLTPPNSPIPF